MLRGDAGAATPAPARSPRMVAQQRASLCWAPHWLQAETLRASSYWGCSPSESSPTRELKMAKGRSFPTCAGSAVLDE